MKKLSYIGTALLSLVPLVSHAQRTPQTFAELVSFFVSLINMIVPLLLSVAVLVFFWGIVRYIFDAGGEGKQSGKDLIIWGSVAFFVMISIFGIVAVIKRTFGL